MSDCATFFREVGPDTDSMSGPNATLKVDRTLGCFGKSPQKKGWWNDWCVGVKKQRNDWCIDSITCLSLSNMKKTHTQSFFVDFILFFSFLHLFWPFEIETLISVFEYFWQFGSQKSCQNVPYVLTWCFRIG